jgi:hypothetical protein
MITKIHLMIMILVICISLVIGCRKKEEYQVGELATKEAAKDTTDNVLTLKPKPVNYDSMLIVVGELVEAIKENPTDIDYRRELVAVSYDTSWDTILSAGFGKPSPAAETESIAIKNAERAATADALRWASYIKRWSVNPDSPLDSLNVEIQDHRVVAKKVFPDQTVSVLIEIHSSKIL